ncbi:Olfactory receptor 51F2 [Lemmus lemmus]
MPYFNQSNAYPTVFFLTGIPGLETSQAWISIPFCCLYAIAISGHSYCFHPDVMKLSCSDTKVNSAFGLVTVISTAGLDSVLILLSYVLIIRSVLCIASKEERKKAFGTCVSHLSAVAIFYIPMISLSLVHRFAKHAPPFVHTLIANVYLLIPPVMNPIIYSVKTKQIRKAVIKVFFIKPS